MGIRFETITNRDALLNPAFILPQVAMSREFEAYVCYAAIADNRLAGILVADPAKFEPEILSIAVSPEYEGNGIASALLEYALYDMAAEYGDHDFETDNRFVANISAKVGNAGAIRRVLEKNGFELLSEGVFCEVEIVDIEGNRYIQNPKYSGNSKDTVFLSLKETDRKLVKSFADKLIRKSLIEEFSAAALDEDLSVFGIKNGGIVSCLLFAKESQGVVQNYFLYNTGADSAAGDKDLLRLFNLSAFNAMNKFSSDIRLSFWVGNKAVRKMFDKIFPDAKLAEEALSFELPFAKLATDPEDRFTDDLVLDLYDNANMVCADCKFCSRSVIACDKYIQKPDGVLEGGGCGLKEI